MPLLLSTALTLPSTERPFADQAVTQLAPRGLVEKVPHQGGNLSSLKCSAVKENVPLLCSSFMGLF